MFILNDKEAYGLGVATNFKNAAKKLGITVVGFTAGTARRPLRGPCGQDQGVRRAGGLPRRPRLRERREADQGHQVGQSGDPCCRCRRLHRPARRQRRGGQRRVHQRRRPAAEQADGQGRDVRQAVQQVDRRDANPYAAYGAEAAEVLLNDDCQGRQRPRAVVKALLRVTVTTGSSATSRSTRPGDTSGACVTGLQAERQEPQPGDDADAAGEPGEVGIEPAASESPGEVNCLPGSVSPRIPEQWPRHIRTRTSVRTGAPSSYVMPVLATALVGLLVAWLGINFVRARPTSSRFRSSG